MKIAIPTANETLCAHFGHCQEFYIFNVDKQRKTIENVEKLTPPPHEPGVLPRWLGEMKVNLIIAGGMGSRAQGLFGQNGIEVLVGAQVKKPEELISDYLSGVIETGENVCDH